VRVVASSLLLCTIFNVADEVGASFLESGVSGNWPGHKLAEPVQVNSWRDQGPSTSNWLSAKLRTQRPSNRRREVRAVLHQRQPDEEARPQTSRNGGAADANLAQLDHQAQGIIHRFLAPKGLSDIGI